MKIIYYLFGLVVVAVLTLVSCNSKPSLQKYFVEKSKSNEFMSFDLGTDIIKAADADISADQKKALEAVWKLNVLIFKPDSTNTGTVRYKEETAQVKSILKKGEYEELMRIGSGKDGASISMLGENDDIDEFVVFLHKDGTFGLIRVLGNDMTPNDVMTIMQLVKKSGVDMAQLQPALDEINGKKGLEIKFLKK